MQERHLLVAVIVASLYLTAYLLFREACGAPRYATSDDVHMLMVELHRIRRRLGDAPVPESVFVGEENLSVVEQLIALSRGGWS
jgi:hypothetical protein